MDRGRRYAVRAGSIEPEARHAGARVHFDIDHDADGDVAIGVELREGTRVSPRQRRFGDLVGARGRFSKVEPSRVDEGGIREAATHPSRVADTWAGFVMAGDSGAAARLFSPTATSHHGGTVTIGPKQIRRSLEDHPRFGSGLEPDAVEGAGEAVRIRWRARDGETAEDAVESHLVVEHGEIVEQWTGEVRVLPDTDDGIGPIEVSAEGGVTARERDAVVESLRRTLASHRGTFQHVNLRLEWLPTPAPGPRARARVTVDVDGDLVRAGVSAETVSAAADRLTERLDDRLRRRADHRRTLRRRGPTSDGGWRHGDEVRQRPLRARPESTRRAIVRRPTWSAEPSTFDEAVFDLEALDLDFLLFVDLATGQDAVVDRRPHGVYGVRLAGGHEPDLRIDSIATVELDPMPAPVLEVREAREHLDESGEDWVFFVDRTSGRGNVLHRRDDGNDGLVTPRSVTGDPVTSS